MKEPCSILIRAYYKKPQACDAGDANMPIVGIMGPFPDKEAAVWTLENELEGVRKRVKGDRWGIWYDIQNVPPPIGRPNKDPNFISFVGSIYRHMMMPKKPSS